MEVQDVVAACSAQNVDDAVARVVALSGNEDHVASFLERALVGLQRFALVRASLQQPQQEAG